MKPAAQLVWLDTCGSTNDEAWARATAGIRAVAATHQTRGRGRRGDGRGAVAARAAGGRRGARISPFRRFYEQHPTLMAEGQRVFELEKEFPIKPDAMETQEYSTLSKMYLDKVAPEFEHVESASEREWLYEEYEREIGATLSRSQQA